MGDSEGRGDDPGIGRRHHGGPVQPMLPDPPMRVPRAVSESGRCQVAIVEPTLMITMIIFSIAQYWTLRSTTTVLVELSKRGSRGGGTSAVYDYFTVH